MAVVDLRGIIHKVHFGDLRYQHFRDSTPLKLYSDLDHNDIERMRKYHQRHARNQGLAGILAKKYLWS